MMNEYVFRKAAGIQWPFYCGKNAVGGGQPGNQGRKPTVSSDAGSTTYPSLGNDYEVNQERSIRTDTALDRSGIHLDDTVESKNSRTKSTRGGTVLTKHEIVQIVKVEGNTLYGEVIGTGETITQVVDEVIAEDFEALRIQREAEEEGLFIERSELDG